MKSEEKNTIALIKQELAKLKNSEDEKVKVFYQKVTGVMTELAKLPATEDKEDEEKKEDNKEDVEETSEEKVEDKPSEKVEDKPEEIVEEKAEEKVEDKKEEVKPVEKTEAELNKAVSEKLNEAALELAANEEVLKVKDAKILELTTELEKYKEVERIELEKQYDIKINNLVELYKNLGIKKDGIELKKEFSEAQVDKLSIDLSKMIPKPSEMKKGTVRHTKLSVDLELNRDKPVKNKLMNDAERAQALFFE